MAHYVFLNEDNVVIEVIVGIDENQSIEGLEPAIWYGNFRNKKCLRTSYNGKIRGKFAGIGDTYNELEDIFVSPQPFASWTRVGSFWEAPKPRPNEFSIWNENLGEWVANGN